MKVLFVGADLQAADKINLAVRLRWPNASVVMAAEEADSLEAVDYESPDVVMFQANADSKRSERFIRDLRRFSDVPLIILEQEGGEGHMDEVIALESGADDFIHHSAGIIDVIARLVALIRRVRRSELSEGERTLSSGSLILDPSAYQVFLQGNRLTLTSTEFRLLQLLLKNRGTVLTHRSLEVSLWGDRGDASGMVKKYIQRLRRKLGDDPHNPQWIANIHGVGYKFLGPGSADTTEWRPSALAPR